MKAIILAGGYGTRLWPISRNRPKMLLPLRNETILDTILEPLESDSRIDEVIISTNRRFNEELKSHVEQYGYRKPRLVLEPTQTESEKLGALDALARLIEEEQLSTDLVVIAGDHYVDFPLADFFDYFESVDGPAITALDVGRKKDATPYGVIDLEGEQVVSFVEKPDEPPSTLISPACYAFPAEQIDLLHQYLGDGGDPDAPGWFIKWLINKTNVYAYVIDGMIMDVGTRTNYLKAVSWALDEDHHVARTATVENSKLKETTMILGDADIRDSEVVNSVIFPGATVDNAIVRDSVVDKESSLADTCVQESLVGPWTQIRSD